MKTQILTILAALAMCSCTTIFDISDVTPSDFTGVAGKICDSKGNPIEHIKVTIEIEGMESISAYTSSEGIFIISVEDQNLSVDQVRILIEDIDGEDYGGYFATIKDTVQVDVDQENGFRLSLDYRLSLATASEYNPQV